MFGKTGGGMDTPAFGDAHLATGGEMQTAGLLENKGIRLGYYRTPGARNGWGQVIRYNGDGGLILVAPPRSGKARDVLVGALLEYDQSVIVVDPKGQLAAITKDQRERMGQRVVVLNPFKVWPEILGPTARYNPMALLDPTSPTFGAECRKLAEGLVPPSGNERDSHWTDGARTLLSSVIGHLIVAGDDEDRNLAQMREIIAGPEALLLNFAKDALNSTHAFIRQGLAEYAIDNAPNKAEIAGKISSAREQTFFLSIDTIADNIRGDDFRFGVLKKEPVTVYVILPDEHLDTCGKWFRLVVASALHDLWRGGRGACRVLAILDEFAHIGHLDILEKAAGMAAGHGLQLWPVLQNLTQLKKDYGDNWETFIAGSEIRQFFGTRDQTSAKYVSETSGQRTVTTAGQSIQNASVFSQSGGGSSDSSGQAGQPLIRPHEISGFGPNESLIFGPRNIVIDALRQPYFHTPELRGRYSPDPQHKSDAAPPPPLNPESITTFGDTLAATEAAARKKPGIWHAFFGMLQGKLGWAIASVITGSLLIAYMLWNTRHVNAPEIITDVGKDIAAVAEKSNADEKNLADQQREERTHPYSTATSSQPPRNEPQPAPLPKPAPAAAPADWYAVADKIVTDHLRASEDHGMIASIRGGPSIPGVDNNLLPLSQTLGPVVKAADSLTVSFIVVDRIDIAKARSNPGHEGQHFDNPPFGKAFISLHISPVQAVLGRDGQPITGTGPQGESITLVIVPDGRGITGYIPSDAFAKLK